jgi:hypothetical protein
MMCRQVAFTHGNCLVEIRNDDRPQPDAAFTAFVSLVEDEGSIVRPLVQRDGHRVRIYGTTEPMTLTSAISFLEQRYGTPTTFAQGCSMGGATVGSPVVLA